METFQIVLGSLQVPLVAKVAANIDSNTDINGQWKRAQWHYLTKQVWWPEVSFGQSHYLDQSTHRRG
jgi:hypothetical protein